jgi:iron complex outermembrane receptor protein
MRWAYFFFFLIALGGRVRGQGLFVAGTVRGDGEVLVGATVRLAAFAAAGLAAGRLTTVTGRKGEFRLGPVEGDSGVLIVSDAGYRNKTVPVRLVDGVRMNVALEAGISELDQVVVTGVSRATLLRENPLAMRAVSKREIEQSATSNVIDAIAGHVPGLAVVKTGPNVSKPFINGLGYNRVLTLYDGIRVETQQWGDEHGVPMDDYVIERAEVIKGPASLLYGSDAIAGVLQLFPAIPHAQDGALRVRVLSEYQSNNGLAGNGILLSRGSEHWSWALRGSERIARSYTNPLDGRVYNTGFKTSNASGFVGYASVTGYSRLNLTYYDNHQAIPDGSRDSLTRKFTYQIYEVPMDDIKNRPVVPSRELNGYGLSALTQRIQDLRVYTEHSYSFGFGDLGLSAGFEENRRREFNHPTHPRQVGEDLLLRTLSYGARYNAPSFLKIDLSAGVNGMWQTNRNGAGATDLPIPNYHLFDLGSYLYGKWKGGNWTLAGGLRYDRRTVYRKYFEGISGSIGATLRLGQNISLKANIARGYRAPNITEMASNGLDPGAHIYYIGNPGFSPEFSLQEDAGLSGEWEDWDFTVNGFNNHIQNYIYQNLVEEVIVPGNRTFQFQQTDAQLYGGDAELRLHPVPWGGWRLEEGFSAVYGFNRSGLYRKAGSSGEYLPFIPPPRLLSAAGYERAVASGLVRSWRVRAEVDHNWRQDRYLGLFKTETPTAAYTLVNLTGHVELRVGGRHHLQLQAQVNNLFDLAYQSHLSRLQYFEYYTASRNGRLGIYEMGRNVCFKVIWELR